MSQAAVERQLAAVQAAKLELESKVREKELVIERLEGDRRWLAEREKEEREEKERERERAAEEDARRQKAQRESMESSRTSRDSKPNGQSSRASVDKRELFMRFGLTRL